MDAGARLISQMNERLKQDEARRVDAAAEAKAAAERREDEALRQVTENLLSGRLT